MQQPARDVPLHEVLPTQLGYDAWAAHYDNEDNPLVLLESQVVPELLPELNGLSVLDLGCGTGRHSLAMAAAGARVTAVDFSQAMLDHAAAKEGARAIEFVDHDLSQPLPFENERFDLVTCHLVTDHIDDLESLFSEMRRVCRISGRIINTCMHPAMHLLNVTARFVDPVSGKRVPIETSTHSTSDYVMAIVASTLDIRNFAEHALDAELAEKSPRAEKYIDWPMLLVMQMRRT